ncbi:MAG TPA: hypothetical protein VF221_12085 [Chloroflexota bacterium]
MSHKVIRNTLIGLEVLVCIAAIYGSVSLLVDAAGFGVDDEWMRGSPFTNYQIPALSLLVGVGGSSLLAAGALLRRRSQLGTLFSIGAGVSLVSFEIAEAHVIGLRNFQQPLMFVVGVLIASFGAMLLNANTVREQSVTAKLDTYSNTARISSAMKEHSSKT